MNPIPKDKNLDVITNENGQIPCDNKENELVEIDKPKPKLVEPEIVLQSEQNSLGD